MIQLEAMSSFVAIDFETANHSKDSACAVGLATVRRGRIEAALSFLIRPPSSHFVFTGIHGLGWEDVRDAPTFGELWPTLRDWIDNAEFIAAHNAPFDNSILHACCATYGIRAPGVPFTCTVQLARAQWGIYPTRFARCLPANPHSSTSPRRGVGRGSLCAYRACGPARGLVSWMTLTLSSGTVRGNCQVRVLHRRQGIRPPQADATGRARRRG